MTKKLEDYDDISVYGIDASRREALLARYHECSVVWTTSDGWPVGVMHIYVWHEGRFWVTCTRAFLGDVHPRTQTRRGPARPPA